MDRFRYRMLIVALLVPVLVTNGAEGQNTEQTAKQLEQALIAPCCWRQPLDIHQSGTVDNMKTEIRLLLKEGQTSEQIMSYYIERYGEQIRSTPKKEGFNLLAWLLPGFALMVGLGVISVSLKKWRSHRSQSIMAINQEGTTNSTKESDVPHQAQIVAELSELD